MAAMHEVPEVARILNLTPQTVRDLIATQQLRAIDVSIRQQKPRWRIPDEALQQFIQQRATVEAVPA